MMLKELRIRVYVWNLKRIMKERLGIGCYIPYDSRIIGKEYISIADKFYAYGNLRLEAFAIEKDEKDKVRLKIGKNVAVGNYCHIGAMNYIEIGDNVLMGSNVLITDHMHGQATLEEMHIPPNERTLFSKGIVVIENNVFIGDGAKIMPGVKIGEGAIVGSNAVVTHDIEKYSIVAGVPAVKIR